MVANIAKKSMSFRGVPFATRNPLLRGGQFTVLQMFRRAAKDSSLRNLETMRPLRDAFFGFDASLGMTTIECCELATFLLRTFLRRP